MLAGRRRGSADADVGRVARHGAFGSVSPGSASVVSRRPVAAGRGREIGEGTYHPRTGSARSRKLPTARENPRADQQLADGAAGKRVPLPPECRRSGAGRRSVRGRLRAPARFPEAGSPRGRGAPPVSRRPAGIPGAAQMSKPPRSCSTYSPGFAQGFGRRTLQTPRRPLVRVQQRLCHRHIHCLAATGDVTLVQRREHRACREEWPRRRRHGSASPARPAAPRAVPPFPSRPSAHAPSARRPCGHATVRTCTQPVTEQTMSRG